MKLFDSHCHLNDPCYAKDMESVIKRAEAAEVKSMMIVGITEKTSKQAVAIASAHPQCYASVGVHPHDAKSCTQDALDRLKTLAENPQVKAWGEIGVDFNRMYSPRNDQEKWFERQMEAADSLGLPLIFHERDSGGRFLEMLNDRYASRGRAGVVHCFSGDQKELEGYLDLGLYIGITGILTIKTRGERLRRLVPYIPDDRILVETDAPYLTPAPEKNQTTRNEPAFVRTVLLNLAEVKNQDPEWLSETVWHNTCRLFNIETHANPSASAGY